MTELAGAGRRGSGWRLFAVVGLAWVAFATGWAWLTYRQTLHGFEQDMRSHLAGASQNLSTMIDAARSEAALVASLPAHVLDGDRAREAGSRPIEILADDGQAPQGGPAPAQPPAAGRAPEPQAPRIRGDGAAGIEWLMTSRTADGRLVALHLPGAQVTEGWAALRLPEGAAITLISEGTMWLRWPHERRFVGMDISRGPLWSAIQRAGTASGRTRILPTNTDSVERLVVWERLTAAPGLTLAAGVPVAHAAAAWRAAYALPILLTALGGLALLGLMLLARARAEGAERDRDQALAEAQAAERRWMLALDAAELGVFDWNPQSGDLWLSPRFKEILGYRDADFGSTYDAWQSRVHPDDLPAALVAVDRHLRGETPTYRSRHRMRAADGRWRWTVARGQVVARDAQRRPVRMIGTQVDVTAQVEAELLRDQRDRAEAANQAKSEFLSRMSHELRTPLNAVIGFAQLMATDPAGLPGGQRERLQRIQESSEHLLALIGDLLDLSRIEAGELAVDPQPLDAWAQVASVRAELQAFAARHGVTLDTAASGSRPGVMADAMRLHQVLLNLVGNGIKYNRPGGRVGVEVTNRRESDGSSWTRFDVTDDGPGMTAEQVAHLFEPFNRLGAERGPVEGTGIGLTIARQLVVRMHGRIEVESEPGRGSRFSVLLPGCDAPESAPPAPSAAVATAPRKAPAGPHALRVLYVEDNPVNVLLVQQMSARRTGIMLEVAESGGEALARVQAAPPDLLLVDMNLGDMTGLELRACLAADASTAGIPCVAVSADALPSQVEAARAAGFAGYLTKPLKMAALHGVFERAASGALARDAQVFSAPASPPGS